MSNHQVFDKKEDQFVDLESGGSTSEDEGHMCVLSAGCGRPHKILNGGWSGFTHFDESLPGDDADATSTCSNSACATFHTPSPQSLNLAQVPYDVALIDKSRKKSPKKAPKPPRPPRPPSLDAADHKLIKEISELAMLKRARIERMKALRKARATKSTSSSSSNMWAMIVTIAFCLVIILQGNIYVGSNEIWVYRFTT